MGTKIKIAGKIICLLVSVSNIALEIKQASTKKGGK